MLILSFFVIVALFSGYSEIVFFARDIFISVYFIYIVYVCEKNTFSC